MHVHVHMRTQMQVDELLADEDDQPDDGTINRVKEWVERTAVRVQPPAEFPRGAIDLLRPGDAVEGAVVCSGVGWLEYTAHCS